MQPGEVLLVQAVGSGVGTAAVQLGRATGCTVVGTSRTAEKLDQARALGLDHAVLAARELDPTALATDITDAVGAVDVVLELVGGDYVATDLAVTGLRGRIVLVGMMGGTRTQLDLGALLMKRIRVYGTTLRGRSVEEKAAATSGFARDVVPLLASGEIVPVIARTLPLDEGPAAYDLLASDARVRRHRAGHHLTEGHPIRIRTRGGLAARSTWKGRTESRPITQFTVS